MAISNLNLEAIQKAIEEEVSPQVSKFLPKAQHALHTSDRSTQASLIITVGFTKKVTKPKPTKTNPEPEPVESYDYYIHPRVNMPEPIVRQAIEMDAHGQMRLL